MIAPNHPVPHLVNKRLYAAALLESKKGHRAVGIVPVPDSAPPYLLLTDGKRFVRTENILLRWLPTLFDAYTVRESCILAVTRNADISFDDEKFEDNEEDFRRQMKKLLKQRDHLAVVRLELGRTVSEEFQKILFMLVRVQTHQVFVDECPLNMRYVFRLIGELPKERSSRLLYPSYRPRWAEDLWQNQSILAQVQQKDRLLFYPYDSVEPFLRLLNEAADDPHVLSIKIAIYRLASSSKIAQTLCRAAENGKEVLVLMELRARFDEENNLVWSKMLEESGCQVIYGAEGFKCHSKICLITLRSRNKTSYLTQIGTGNYNEKTSELYTDYSFITADLGIGEEASNVFQNLAVQKLTETSEKMLVAPLRFKSVLLDEMDRVINAARLGRPASMILKNNSISDRDIILKLEEASCAGVRIDMIVRGICCVRAEVPGKTENLHIRSLVGRYLEHGRIYSFYDGTTTRIYIASGDFLTRNTECRVEVGVRVEDPVLIRKLSEILQLQLRDNVNAREMKADGSYQKVKAAPDEALVNGQMGMYDLLKNDWTARNDVPEETPARPEPVRAAPVETPAPAAEAPKAPSEPTPLPAAEPAKPAVVPETAPQTEQTVHHPVAVAHPAPHTPPKPRGGLMDLFEQFHHWLRPKR